MLNFSHLVQEKHFQFEFGANRQPVGLYDFLLVINSNLGLISHRY